jgi:trehalose 6-phosphate synthase/phosphatase
MGDDVTDEDLFKALSEQAITIKVNGSHSAAKYYLNDYNQVRNFLKSLPSKTSLTKIMNRFKNLLPYSSVRRRE